MAIRRKIEHREGFPIEKGGRRVDRRRAGLDSGGSHYSSLPERRCWSRQNLGFVGCEKEHRIRAERRRSRNDVHEELDRSSLVLSGECLLGEPMRSGKMPMRTAVTATEARAKLIGSTNVSTQ